VEYAVRTGLPATAGSDIHDVDQFEDGDIFGVYLDKKLETIKDYAEAIRSKAIAGLRVTPGRAMFRGREMPALPVDIRDENDKGTRQDFWEFMGERLEDRIVIPGRFPGAVK
jgi:hypothetical protein